MWNKEEAKKLSCPYMFSQLQNSFCKVDSCMAWEWTETEKKYVGDVAVRDNTGYTKIEPEYKSVGITGICRAIFNK